MTFKATFYEDTYGGSQLVRLKCSIQNKAVYIGVYDNSEDQSSGATIMFSKKEEVGEIIKVLTELQNKLVL